MREIMQEIALAGLSRAGFFEKAAFYGGTALRIFQGLNRYSEDRGFSLLAADPEFSLEPYFDAIKAEFAALGVQVSINEKVKAKRSNIESAFLKSDTIWKELVLEGVVPQTGVKMMPNLKIKIEVDTEPPSWLSDGRKAIDPAVFLLCEDLYLAEPFCRKDACAVVPQMAKPGQRQG